MRDTRAHEEMRCRTGHSSWEERERHMDCAMFLFMEVEKEGGSIEEEKGKGEKG